MRKNSPIRSNNTAKLQNQNRRYKKLAAGAVAMVLFTSAIADDLNTQAQKMFNDLGMVGNVTQPQAFKGQAMNTYTGGSLFIRTPTKNYQLMSLQLPYIKGSCGGIDAFGGSFSHISSAQFKAMLKNITSAIPGLLFKMMIDSVEPLLGTEMNFFKSIEGLINGTNINTCNAAQKVANFIAKETDLKQNTCKTAALLKGMASDGAEAAQKCKDAAGINEVDAQAATDPDMKAYLPFTGNLVWEAMKKANPSLDTDDIELVMSITGTTIYNKVIDGGIEPTPILPTIRNASDLLYGNNDGAAVSGTGNIVVDMVKCPISSITEPCLIDPATPRQNVTMQALTYRVQEIMRSISSKIADRSGQPTPSEISFINAVPMPVYKLLSSSTAINNTDIADAKIAQYADYVAIEFAYGLLSRAARMGAEGTGAILPGLDPGKIEQLAIHRANARQALKTLESDRIAAYQKAQSFIAISEDIERMQRTMRQGMSQQLSDLMAFSSTGRRW